MSKIKRTSLTALSAAMAVCAIASVPASATDAPVYSFDNPFYADSEVVIVHPYYGVSGSTVLSDVMSYRILENDTYADTVYVDPSDLENGDYTFQAGIYLEADTADLQDMLHFHVRWDGFDADGNESKYIFTENMVTYGYQWNDDKTNMLLNEIDSSSVHYVGFNSRYGDVDVFSAGPYKVRTVDTKTGEESFLELTVDENTGRAKGIFDTAWYTNTDGKYGYFTIPHYDPETPYGEQFVHENPHAEMHCLSKMTNAWVNEVTGDNKMVQFDVVINQDTPEGVYYIGFNKSQKNPCYMSGLSRTLLPSNVYARMSDEDIDVPVYHNDQDYWLKIVVGGTEEEKAATAEEAYDVDQDGTIGVSDATEVLTTYANHAAGTSSGIQILKSVAADYDIDGDGEISVSDATEILTKYARKASGLE
ncbi:MAG: hypothetical protein J6A30_05205 [Ruminococcus sp.]|nr:hypothetical protein [Ruminococcus sp.]